MGFEVLPCELPVANFISELTLTVDTVGKWTLGDSLSLPLDFWNFWFAVTLKFLTQQKIHQVYILSYGGFMYLCK